MAVMVDAVDGTSGIQQGSNGKNNAEQQILICTQILSPFFKYVCHPRLQ